MEKVTSNQTYSLKKNISKMTQTKNCMRLVETKVLGGSIASAFGEPVTTHAVKLHQWIKY